MTEISVRKMCEADREMLFLWRNHPAIVLQSMSQKTVSQSDHNDWFKRTMASTDVLAFIIEIDAQPAGHIRFDRADLNQAHISAYLLPEYTGWGHGILSIRNALMQVNRSWPGIEIVAAVRSDNPVGQSAFRKCGFELKSLGQANSPFIFTRTFTANEANNIQLYEKLVAEHGYSHCALNWGSREGQIRRFEVLSEIDTLHGKSILDVGCGLAHFLDWLNERKIDAEYVGLDLTEGMLSECRNRHPSNKFIHGNILSTECMKSLSFDYVFASGIFTYFTTDRNIAAEIAIINMWNASKKGIAFNCLSSWAQDQSADEYYAEPSFLLDVCRRLSPWVVLRHDYHPRDVTVYVTREPRQ